MLLILKVFQMFCKNREKTFFSGGWGKAFFPFSLQYLYPVLRQNKTRSFQVHLAIWKNCFYVFFWNESWGSGLSWYCCWWNARNCLDFCLQRNRQGARKCAEQNYRIGWIQHVTPNQKEALEQVYLPEKKTALLKG